MAYAVLVENGVVVSVLATENAPDGWIVSDDKVGVGWSYESGTFISGTFTEPTEDPAAALARERADMRVTPVQMRLALAGAGMLDAVNAVAAADASAALVWEYAIEIVRDSAFIDGLAGLVIDPDTDAPITAERIDDLFRAAAEVDL